jgi:formate dehydrogenase maturation protein FdhE
MQKIITEIKCQEIKNCNGILKRFTYCEFDGSKISQFKCDKCNNYIKIINGKVFSMGKYNGLD